MSKTKRILEKAANALTRKAIASLAQEVTIGLSTLSLVKFMNKVILQKSLTWNR